MIDENRTQNMIVFHNQHSCDVPLNLLEEEEQALLQKKGHVAERGIFRWINFYDFPGIFYTLKEVPLHDVTIPLYVQSILQHPAANSIGKWYNDRTYRQQECDAAERLQQDLEAFPFDPFHQGLFELEDIALEYDSQLTSRAQAFRDKKIVFGSSLPYHHFDFEYVATTMLHELYHQVEWKMGKKIIKKMFQYHKRWKTIHFGTTFNLQWSDDKFSTGMELAEIFTALTLIRNPEITSEIRPYYHSLLDKMSGQLSLFPAKPKKWYSLCP